MRPKIFFKQRAETKRRKSPGYSRFFSPLHLDPAFILGATSTAAVMSISPSSSSSDSTAMPGNKKKSITSTRSTARDGLEKTFLSNEQLELTALTQQRQRKM